MTNLEHLLENTLLILDNGDLKDVTIEDILNTIEKDINFADSGISSAQCLEICQYFYNTWKMRRVISKIPYLETNEYTGMHYFVCSHCKNWIDRDDTYCMVCGQELDWYNCKE